MLKIIVAQQYGLHWMLDDKAFLKLEPIFFDFHPLLTFKLKIFEQKSTLCSMRLIVNLFKMKKIDFLIWIHHILKLVMNW